jgi:hypothetical protein
MTFPRFGNSFPRFFFLLFFFALQQVWAGAPMGEPQNLEPALQKKSDILFFSGFETSPWEKAWSMVWGPEPAAHGDLVQGPEALSGHSLRVLYPAGGIGGDSGFLFRSSFSKWGILGQESIYLRYYLKFEPGFDFVKGGKLPGVAGGQGNTGGHKPNGKDGWSARIMWRGDGKIVQYVYHPDQPGDYGEDFEWSFGGCPRFFKPGQWQCVETYVQMNTPGKKDGIIRSWLDGDKALEVTNLRFRDIPDLKIDQFEFETFFGGGDPSWASPREQYAFFDGFVLSKGPISPEPSYSTKVGNTAPKSLATGDLPKGTLLFDGEHQAWGVEGWSQGKYDAKSILQNHSPQGSKSLRVEFPKEGWGGVQLAGPETTSTGTAGIGFWVLPTFCDVEFRVRLEYHGKQTGVEKVLTGAKGWGPGEWNPVFVPWTDLALSGPFDRIVLISNSGKGCSTFFIDDLYLLSKP